MLKKANNVEVTTTANLDSFVDENCKYSNFLADLIIKLLILSKFLMKK